jgi:hypothetical protein
VANEIGAFRSAWEEKIAASAYRKISVALKRGEPRIVYLLRQDDRVFRRFCSAYRKLISVLAEDRALLKAKQVEGGRKLDLLFPVVGCNALGVVVKRYVARSQREVSRRQAKDFLRRIGKEVPRDVNEFVMRSTTGRRYTLVVRTSAGSDELPLRVWNVLASVDLLNESAAPKRSVSGERRGDNKSWRKAKGWRLQGRSGGGGREPGLSFLYGRLAS